MVFSIIKSFNVLFLFLFFLNKILFIFNFEYEYLLNAYSNRLNIREHFWRSVNFLQKNVLTILINLLLRESLK